MEEKLRNEELFYQIFRMDFIVAVVAQSYRSEKS